MSDIAHIIRGVLIQVAQARLLLPNATIAEVLSFAPPEPVADAPDWLLGRIRWRGWQLPLVS
ncbi:MAG TPA: chemotaxis protein CheW, partial [Thermomonas sp.]|nr:chemotaxis protein CheW [Thermomonas sp.]HRA56261.1 chemotaxis protein CheW [Thermomonas sp.]